MSVKTHLVAVGVLLASTVAVSAAPATPDRSPAKAAKTADAAQVRAAAVSEPEDESANCSKVRKRLWVESEGWVVRKVTTCR